MPKLWNDTIEEHRRTVHAAILDTTAALVAEHGLAGVTMSQIAQAAGIGRATLYKYFPDVEAIMTAWHQRQIATHLDQLTTIAEQPGDPAHRLHAVLHAYALIQHQRREHGGELATLLHRGGHVAHATAHLREFLAHLLTDATTAGAVRTDIPAREQADYCLHALTAAAGLPSKAAVERLVTLTLAGLRQT